MAYAQDLKAESSICLVQDHLEVFGRSLAKRRHNSGAGAYAVTHAIAEAPQKT